MPGPSAPQFTGEPLARGAVEVGARVAERNGGTSEFHEIDKAAVHVPRVDASGGFLAGATSWLAIGGEIRVSNDGAAFRTAADAPRLPLGERTVFGLGPEIDVGARFGQGDALFLGGSLSASLTSVGWASYERGASGAYRLSAEGRQFFVVPRFAALAGGRATRWLSIFTGAVLSPQLVDVGFSYARIDGSTLRFDGSVAMPLFGARVDLPGDPGAFLRAVATAPIGTRYVDYQPAGLDLAFGFRVR